MEKDTWSDTLHVVGSINHFYKVLVSVLCMEYMWLFGMDVIYHQVEMYGW